MTEMIRSWAIVLLTAGLLVVRIQVASAQGMFKWNKVVF